MRLEDAGLLSYSVPMIRKRSLCRLFRLFATVSSDLPGMLRLLLVVTMVIQALCPNAAAVANKKTPASLKDYVSCQFTEAEEAAWKRQETTTFQRKQQAAANELESESSKQKGVKHARAAVGKAQNELALKSAIQSIPSDDLKERVQTAADTAISSPADEPEFNTPDDLLCSRSLLSWQETADIFGRRIANTYLAVQVVVRNLNQNSDYLIQDVVLAAPNTKFGSGRDKLPCSRSGDSRSVTRSTQYDHERAGHARRHLRSNCPYRNPGSHDLQQLFESSKRKQCVDSLHSSAQEMVPRFYGPTILNRLNDLTFSASTTLQDVGSQR